MGFLSDAKAKLTKAVDSQGDKIDTGVDKAKDALDKLDGKDDDIT
jgi:hypothetical protein